MIVYHLQYAPRESLAADILQDATGLYYDTVAGAFVAARPKPAPLSEDPACPGVYTFRLDDAHAAIFADGSYSVRPRDEPAENLLDGRLGSFVIVNGDDGTKSLPKVSLPYLNNTTIDLYGAVIRPAKTA